MIRKEHFKPQCFKSTTGLKKTLWPNAIPSLDQDTTEVIIVNLHDKEELENGYLLKNSTSDSTKEVSPSCSASTNKLPICNPIESLLGRSPSDCSLIETPKKKKIEIAFVMALGSDVLERLVKNGLAGKNGPFQVN
ncbi:hypothetical protein QTP88_015457 [Uroleucon formosanum]